MRQSRDGRHITTEHDQASRDHVELPVRSTFGQQVRLGKSRHIMVSAYLSLPLTEAFSTAQTAGLHPVRGLHTRDLWHGYRLRHRRAPVHQAVQWSRLVR